MKSLAVTLGVVLLVFGLVSGANADLIDDLNIMGRLFNEFQTAVERQESDMNYFLTRLGVMNTISDTIGRYLQGLDEDALEAARDEAARAAGTNMALRDYVISLADNPLYRMPGLFDTEDIDPSNLQNLQDIYAYVPGSIFLPNPNPVPEPATMLLLASGLVGLAGLRKKFTRS